ncbi:MAG: PilZ domain-containing protein [Pseudomonadota bacterium]
MSVVQERRDAGTERVPFSTLVEVCGSASNARAFEAQAVDVSARGMHLRTAYLPEEGDPLVCRFENGGEQIVVEGVVAWRRESGRGGEFGVKFTALDSRGVEALRKLTGLGGTDEAPEAPAPVGGRVRLHIDGLGSPMKARVKAAAATRLQVGSSLEFLKIGRKLEVEDLERGARRDAEIDGVSVIVDPSTRVPQLIVALRFEEDATPSPSTSDIGEKEPRPRSVHIPGSAVTTDARPLRAGASSAKPSDGNARRPSPASDSDDEPEPEMRGRVALLAERAGEKAKAAGGMLQRLSAEAKASAVGWLDAAKRRVRGAERSASTRPRTTAPAPRPQNTEKPRLRSQSGKTETVEPRLKVSKKVALVSAASAIVAVSTLAFVAGGPDAPPPGAHADTSAAAVVALTTPPPHPAAAVTANVPLFGPTPLATTEPAPRGPAPGTAAAAIEAAERAEAQALAPRPVPDLGFADERPKAKVTRSAERDGNERSARSDDGRSFGRGRLHEPTIHRIRLDGPGTELRGTAEPTGFTVLVSGRKAMEPAGPIAKRDSRIAKSVALNGPEGTKISFRFKGTPPAYRVRLRNDYVEFLISAPEPKAQR